VSLNTGTSRLILGKPHGNDRSCFADEAFPRINLEVPVSTTRTDLTLNRGVGLILARPRSDSRGNLESRDTGTVFFRGLMDVAATIPARASAIHRDGSLQILAGPDKSVNKTRFPGKKPTTRRNR